MINDSLKLHLGCGSVYLDGWVNIDLDSDVADIQHDLRNPLPFDDGSVDYIFAEHFIEHLTQAEAKVLLAECHRVLKDNGTIRLTTPSLYVLLTNYLKGDLNEWQEYWMPPTKAHMVNEGMRSWGHCFVYDADELVRFLNECNFNKLKFEGWRESDIEAFVGIENRNFHKELIIEATKTDIATQTDFLKVREAELLWTRTINDSYLEKIKELELYNCSLSASINENESIQDKYVKDLLNHINNQDSFIRELKRHIASLKNTLIEDKE